jgi:small-conductance mechanosensitive channel
MVRLLPRLLACFGLLISSATLLTAAEATPAPAPIRTPTLAPGKDTVRAATEVPAGTLIDSSNSSAAAGAVDVIIWNRSLAQFRSSLDFPDPKIRAAAAMARIEFLLEDRSFQTIRAQFTELAGQPSVRFYAGPHLIFALTAADLNPASGETLAEAAERTRSLLNQLIADHAEQQSLTRIIRSLAEAFVALTLFAFFWLGVARLRARTIAGIHARLHRAGRRIRIVGHDAGTIVFNLVDFGCRILALGLVLAAGYVAATFSLNRFPYTRPWAEQMQDLFIDAASGLTQSAVQEIPNLLSVLIIFFVTRGMTRVLGGWFSTIESGRAATGLLDPESARATRRLLVIGMWIFAATVAYPYLPGSHSEAFRGISVLIGLMVTLGGSGFVGQIIGGLAAIYSRSVRTGDHITVGEISGVVREVGMLSTKVVTRTREEVTIPNAMLISSAVRNHSRGPTKGVAVTTGVTIGYDAPWRLVEAMLKTAADRTEGLLNAPEPTVLQTALEDFYVRYELTALVESAERRGDVLSRLHGHIQDVFNENGIQIMSPNFSTQPQSPVLVPKAEWHRPPTPPQK